jgi:hypothetical protein
MCCASTLTWAPATGRLRGPRCSTFIPSRQNTLQDAIYVGSVSCFAPLTTSSRFVDYILGPAVLATQSSKKKTPPCRPRRRSRHHHRPQCIHPARAPRRAACSRTLRHLVRWGAPCGPPAGCTPGTASAQHRIIPYPVSVQQSRAYVCSLIHVPHYLLFST